MRATFAAYNLLLPMYADKKMPKAKARLEGILQTLKATLPALSSSRQVVNRQVRRAAVLPRLPVPNNNQSCGESRRTVTTICPRPSPVQRRPAYRRTRMLWKVSMKFLASSDAENFNWYLPVGLFGNL